MWSTGEMINDKGITKYPGKKPVSLLLLPRQIPHGLPRKWNRWNSSKCDTTRIELSAVQPTATRYEWQKKDRMIGSAANLYTIWVTKQGSNDRQCSQTLHNMSDKTRIEWSAVQPTATRYEWQKKDRMIGSAANRYKIWVTKQGSNDRQCSQTLHDITEK